VTHEGIKTCQEGCEPGLKGADCVQTIDTDDLANDNDNFSCEQVVTGNYKEHVCNYTGCKSDAECGDNYKCKKISN
jgi:hypothetical protein